MGWIVKTSASTYRVNWRDPAGRQRARTFRTKKEAQRFAAQVDADTARGTYVDPTPRGGCCFGTTPTSGSTG